MRDDKLLVFYKMVNTDYSRFAAWEQADLCCICLNEKLETDTEENLAAEMIQVNFRDFWLIYILPSLL